MDNTTAGVASALLSDSTGSSPFRLTLKVDRLLGAGQVILKPGEKKTVVFDMPADILSFYNRDMNLVVESGRYTVMVGSSSDDIRLSGEFEIKGERHPVGAQRKYFTEVHEEG